jgi:3-oxoacyl-[acyl-carrier-protein] synthase III
MAFLDIPDVRITGFSACIPKNSESNHNLNLFSTAEAEKFITTTGVESRRVSTEEICTSDLCYSSAVQLIKDLGWSKEDIDCLIFVSQTPDYILPASSCILQSRLGLSEECYALDISLGCSGWVYGLSVISALISTGNFKKGLLLVGDTISKICSRNDKSTFPLFGDAGTATAIEYVQGATGIKVHTGTDGSGFSSIMVNDGGQRNISTPESFKEELIDEGIKRNRLQLILDGMNVFSFGISKAPESVNRLSEHFSIDTASVDYYIFHQANLYMNEKIRKKLKIEEQKVPYSLKEFGNTSSASIPLTLISQLKDKLGNSSKNIITCGFGVGLSWSSIYFTLDKVVCSEIIEL